MRFKLLLLILIIANTSLLSCAQVKKANKIKFINQSFLPVSTGTNNPVGISSKVKFFSLNENELYVGGVSSNFDSLWLVNLNSNLDIKYIKYFSSSDFSQLGIKSNNTLESIAVFQKQIYFSFSNGSIILIDDFEKAENYNFQFITKFGLKNRINLHRLFPISENEFIIIGNKIDSACTKTSNFEMLVYKCFWNSTCATLETLKIDLNRFLCNSGHPNYYAYNYLNNEILLIEPLTGQIIKYNIISNTSKSFYIKNRINSDSAYNKYLDDFNNYYSMDLESQNEAPSDMFRALNLLDRYYSIHYMDEYKIHILKYKADKYSLFNESLVFDLEYDVKLIDSVSFKKPQNLKDSSTIDSFNYPIEIGHFPYTISGNNLYVLSFEINHGPILGTPLNLYLEQRRADIRTGNLADFKLSVKKFEIPFKAQ